MDCRSQKEWIQMMKIGDTVFVILHNQSVHEGILGDETTAQGFYTRWGSGHTIYFKFRSTTTAHKYNDEDIFSTKEAAKKESFMRLLRWPRLRKLAA